MTIKYSKTVVMYLCTFTRVVPSHQFSIDPHPPLKVVQSAKLLGVMEDDKLNWKHHVDFIVRQASYKIDTLIFRTLEMPADDLWGVYTIFILPKLIYVVLFSDPLATTAV